MSVEGHNPAAPGRWAPRSQLVGATAICPLGSSIGGCAVAVMGALIAVGLLACSTLSDDLRRADDLYRQARYESVEAWTQALEGERSRMSADERLQFEYLKGMCAYRLGRLQDAQHALALAQVLAEDHPQGLAEQDRALLERIMATVRPHR